MAVLYLVQQGTTLRREQGRFLVQVPEAATVEVLIKDVEQVLVLGNIQITTSAITTCLEEQIPVIFLTQMGEYKGHLWSAELRSLETEAAQWGKLADPIFQLQTAQGIVRGKLANSRQLLLRLNRKRHKEEVAIAIAKMAEDLGQVATTEGLESLRGYEGIAAARYFPALGQLITQEGFTLTTRTRRPPKDPVNSLLSFGYTLLFNNVFSAILVEGLHPYLGNLHRSDRPDPQLAFDLMEEFRSPIVDSLVITQINKQTFRPTDFTWFNEDGGTYLSDPARRIFLRAFEARMGEKVSHPDVQEKVSFRRAIQLQVRRYVRAVRAGVPYEAFVRAL